MRLRTSDLGRSPDDLSEMLHRRALSTLIEQISHGRPLADEERVRHAIGLSRLTVPLSEPPPRELSAAEVLAGSGVARWL